MKWIQIGKKKGAEDPQEDTKITYKFGKDSKSTFGVEGTGGTRHLSPGIRTIYQARQASIVFGRHKL